MAVKKNEKIRLTASIPADLFDAFDEFIAREGYVKERAVAGAVRLFMLTPDAIRQAALRGDDDVVFNWFADWVNYQSAEGKNEAAARHHAAARSASQSAKSKRNEGQSGAA